MDPPGKETNQIIKVQNCSMEVQAMETVQVSELVKSTQKCAIINNILVKNDANITLASKETDDSTKVNCDTPNQTNLDVKHNSIIVNNPKNTPGNVVNNIADNRDKIDLYDDTNSGNYIVSISLKNHAITKTKKYNLIKIYRYITSEGVNPESIKMTGFSRAEMSTRNKNDANKMLRKGLLEESNMYTSIPYRLRYRKGVITEWEESIDELLTQLAPNQGKFTLERLKKRKTTNNETTWEESKSILIKFQGDSLPTKLLIGYGHVWIRIEPFVESVKQCYKCLRFGHTQTKCKSQKRRCFICTEESHGSCVKNPKCLNCGEDHISTSKDCKIKQKERFIKKIMAYKNISYKVAREKASAYWQDDSLYSEDSISQQQQQRDDNYGARDEEFYAHDLRPSNHRTHRYPKLPTLIHQNRVDYWESVTGPIEKEISNFRRDNQRPNKHSWAAVASKLCPNKVTQVGNIRSTDNDNARNHSNRGKTDGQRWSNSCSNRFEILHDKFDETKHRLGDMEQTFSRKNPTPNNITANHHSNSRKGSNHFNVEPSQSTFRSRNQLRVESDLIKTMSEEELLEQLLLIIQQQNLEEKLEKKMKQTKYQRKYETNEMFSNRKQCQDRTPVVPEKIKRKISKEGEIELIRKRVRDNYKLEEAKRHIHGEGCEDQPSTSSSIQNFYSSFTGEEDDAMILDDSPSQKGITRNQNKEPEIKSFDIVST
ncbi:uncharacterized protein LOC143217564 [Lasioglossum baleicum]|uniref:uncharacterized protein LOC143217564 n=1 Tax=Lasioglossum baleicum TaxID=434251 RepID=UPI003FCDAB1F